jgi:hypothetical protein
MPDAPPNQPPPGPDRPKADDANGPARPEDKGSATPKEKGSAKSDKFDPTRHLSQPSEYRSALPFVDWTAPYPSYPFDDAEINAFAQHLEACRVVWLSSSSDDVAESLAWQALDKLDRAGQKRVRVARNEYGVSLEFARDRVSLLYDEFPEENHARLVPLSAASTAALEAIFARSSTDFGGLRHQLATRDIFYVFLPSARLGKTVADELRRLGFHPEFVVRTLRAILRKALPDGTADHAVESIERQISSGALNECDLVTEAIEAAAEGKEALLDWLERAWDRPAGTVSPIFLQRYAGELQKIFDPKDKSPLLRVATYLAGNFDCASFEEFRQMGTAVLAGKKRTIISSTTAAGSAGSADQHTMIERQELWTDVWRDELDSICDGAKVRLRGDQRRLPTVRLGMIVGRSDFLSYVGQTYPAFHREVLEALAQAGLLSWRNEALAERFVDSYVDLMASNPDYYLPQKLVALVDGISRRDATTGSTPGATSRAAFGLADRRRIGERLGDAIERLVVRVNRPALRGLCLRHWLDGGDWATFFRMVEFMARRGVIDRMQWWDEYCRATKTDLASPADLSNILDGVLGEAGSMAALVNTLIDVDKTRKTPSACLVQQVWLVLLFTGTWWSWDAHGDGPVKGSLLSGALALDDQRLAKLARTIGSLDFGSGRVCPDLEVDFLDIYASAIMLLTRGAEDDIADRGTELAIPLDAELSMAALAAMLIEWCAICAGGNRGPTTGPQSARLQEFVVLLVNNLDRRDRSRLVSGIRRVEQWLDENLRRALAGRDESDRRMATFFARKRTRARELYRSASSASVARSR